MQIISLIVLLLSLPPAHFYGAGVWRAASSQTEKDRAKVKADRKTRRSQEQGQAAEGGATSSSRLALPFKRSWQYLTDSAASLPPTLDRQRIYLPLAGGRVICLSRETGSLLWSAEPGGSISSPVAVRDSTVFIATRKIADDGSDAGATVRALDSATGLTRWVRDYQRPFTSPLAIGHDKIYAGSADGSFYALAIDTGEVVWKVETQDIVRGRALVTERAVFFGSDDGAVRNVEAERGQQTWKFQTGGKIIGRPALDQDSLYFGSADNYLYSIDLTTGKLRWRSRTGAAIEASPVLVGDRVLVASFDNFVYALSRGSGDRLWKRRMENRITADPIVEGDATMIAPLRGDYLVVFLNSDGRRVNYYRLDQELEIVADPIFSEDTLVVATNKGLVVATITQPPYNPTSARKK